jgi:hypothetical protein
VRQFLETVEQVLSEPTGGSAAAGESKAEREFVTN